MTKVVDVVLPSNPKDREKIDIMLDRMCEALHKINNEREAYKEIAKEIKSVFGLPPRFINKMAKTKYQENFREVQAENETFEALYSTIVEKKNSEDE